MKKQLILNESLTIDNYHAVTLKQPDSPTFLRRVKSDSEFSYERYEYMEDQMQHFMSVIVDV